MLVEVAPNELRLITNFCNVLPGPGASSRSVSSSRVYITGEHSSMRLQDGGTTGKRTCFLALCKGVSPSESCSIASAPWSNLQSHHTLGFQATFPSKQNSRAPEITHHDRNAREHGAQ